MLVDPIKETRFWIETFVIGLNLCPFAESVLIADSVQMAVCPHSDNNQLLEEVLKQLETMHHTDESKLSTSLLIFSNAVTDFNDYLALLDGANDLLVEVGLDSSIQIASFHPEYCFDGVEVDDVSNYSNRSPYPMLHFLRESQVAQVVENYPSPELIPDNNINCLRRMGEQAILDLIKK